MSLREALASGRFVVTGEIGPPKGLDTHEIMEELEDLRGIVQAVNVTDIQSSVMRLGSLAVCAKMVQMGIEPVFQMTCRDRNRLALQSDLLSAAWLGIENVLALTGDHTALGDHRAAKPVYDLDSVSLLRAMVTLESGKDLAGNDLAGSPKFLKGAVVTPCADPVEPQIVKLDKKIEAGAQFIQTQAVYDPRQFESFMKRVSHVKVPILVGIVPLKSAGMAKFMNTNVAGITIPEPLIKRMADAKKEDRMKVSAEIAGRLVKDMKGMCRGTHLMPLGWTRIVKDILQIAEIPPAGN
jgi:5,10-methylenetetrahydrofolate reductase